LKNFEQSLAQLDRYPAARLRDADVLYPRGPTTRRFTSFAARWTSSSAFKMPLRHAKRRSGLRQPTKGPTSSWREFFVYQVAFDAAQEDFRAVMPSCRSAINPGSGCLDGEEDRKHSDLKLAGLWGGFVNLQDAVDRNVFERLHRPAWPHDFDGFDRGFLSEAEM